MELWRKEGRGLAVSDIKVFLMFQVLSWENNRLLFYYSKKNSKCCILFNIKHNPIRLTASTLLKALN